MEGHWGADNFPRLPVSMLSASPCLSHGLSFLLAPYGARSTGVVASLLYSDEPTAAGPVSSANNSSFCK